MTPISIALHLHELVHQPIGTVHQLYFASASG